MTTAIEQLRAMPRSRLVRVYSGKFGCMCGCLGTYYSDREEPLQLGNVVSAKQVTRIINKMLTVYGEDLAVESGIPGETIFFCNDEKRHTYNRNYVAYFANEPVAVAEPSL